MGDLLRRTSAADLEIRGDGRTVAGIAVPFDEPADVGPYTEVFRAGAFARTITERSDRVKFLALHDATVLPLGRATLLREDAAGLYVELRASKTSAGDEALELIRDGALDGLSVGFRPVTQRIADDGLVERLEVALFEVSAVPFPAYPGAQITAVRSGPPASGLTRAAALDRLGELSPPTITTNEARRRLLRLLEVR